MIRLICELIDAWHLLARVLRDDYSCIDGPEKQSGTMRVVASNFLGGEHFVLRVGKKEEVKKKKAQACSTYIYRAQTFQFSLGTENWQQQG